jgi:hypothetical protein
MMRWLPAAAALRLEELLQQPGKYLAVNRAVAGAQKRPIVSRRAELLISSVAPKTQNERQTDSNRGSVAERAVGKLRALPNYY